MVLQCSHVRAWLGGDVAKAARLLTLPLIATCLAPIPALAGHIVTFDVPGAGTTPSASSMCEGETPTGCYGTTPMANNNAGAITGISITNTGIYYGFLRWPNGDVVQLSEPNADTTPGDLNGTYAFSLNTWGAVTGAYQKTDEVFHGFIREPNGHYTEVDDPAAGTTSFQGTLPSTINDRGEVSGYYIDSANLYHGFIRSPQGSFTTVDGPGATAGTFIALEQGLNLHGAVAGWYNAGMTTYGLVRRANGTLVTIEPLASSPATLVGGINDGGSVSGYFINAAGAVSGFLRKPDGQDTIFNVAGPNGALGTGAFTLNAGNDVTGISIDANGTYHGFIGFPTGATRTFEAPGAGTGKLQGTRPTTINDSAQIVGWFLDSNNVAHGFIFCP